MLLITIIFVWTNVINKVTKQHYTASVTKQGYYTNVTEIRCKFQQYTQEVHSMTAKNDKQSPRKIDR